MIFPKLWFTFNKTKQGDINEQKKSASPESIVREIKRKTRCKFTAEENIRIILEGLKGEESIADLCRKEGIHSTMYYKWSKAFLEGGKRRLTGDTVWEAGSEEVGVKKTLQWNKGEPIHEVLSVREDGDHPYGREFESQCE